MRTSDRRNQIRRIEMSIAITKILQGSQDIPPYICHTHFRERAIPRRQFITKSAGAVGLALGAGMLGSGLWGPQQVWAAKPPGVAPNPIPGGIQPFGPGTEVFHIFLPGPGSEPSTITDFHGFIGVAHVTAFGTATPGNRRLFFDTDMRFMKGPYLGMDGRQHNGTFGFF